MDAVPNVNGTGSRDFATSELQDFLDKYVAGEFTAEGTPPMPAALTSKVPPGMRVPVPPNNFYNLNAYNRAEEVEKFYRLHGFMPPPRNDAVEAERLLAIQRFNIDSVNSTNTAIFSKYSRLAQRIFNVPNMIITVRKGTGEQIVLSSSEGCSHKPGDTFAYEESVCSHTMIKNELVQIPDTREDWRFRCLVGAPVSYYGQPLALPASDSSAPIPIGVICLSSETPRPLMSVEDKKMFADISDMIVTEVQNNWQEMRRTKEEKMRNFISEIMAQAVVQYSTVLRPCDNFPKATTSAERSLSLMDAATHNLRTLLDSSFSCLLDLSNFFLSWSDCSDEKRPRASSAAKLGWIGHGRRGSSFTKGDIKQTDAHGLIKVLSMSISEECSHTYDAKEVFSAAETMTCVAAFLQQYTQAPQNKISEDTENHVLESLLPPGTKTHIAIPLFTSSQPHLLAIVATDKPFHKYEPADLSFSLSVSVACLASSVQSRLVEADAAKTAFVSMISHELRTPLHGLLSQLELIREFAPSEVIAETGQLLETAECCGFALRDVLNDVLDFGKMEMTDKDITLESRRPEYGNISLDVLVVEVMNVSYGRRLQWQSVTGELPTSGVEVAVVIEDCLSGWWAHVDVAGLRRVLLNLASNALKYTPTGHITLHVKELPTPPEPLKNGLRLVEFTMQDTGVGMSNDFKQSLFTPFSQENSFSPGSGLGMSICDSIIRRMGGEIHVTSELGIGTTVRVTLLVQFLNVDRPIRTLEDKRTFSRRQISEDFMQRQQRPFQHSPSPPPTPTSYTPPPTTPKPPPTLCISTSQASNTNGAEAKEFSEPIRVLVADDNPISRKILTTLLSRKKVHYEQAADGLQALDIFRRYRPHLVWTDVSMPIMDGIQSAKSMRLLERENQWPRSRIVAITGLSSQNEMKAGLLGEQAIDEWLVKGQINLKNLAGGLEKLQKSLRKQHSGS